MLKVTPWRLVCCIFVCLLNLLSFVFKNILDCRLFLEDK
jgi:hypothetical protein